jgi:hypothetical protein
MPPCRDIATTKRFTFSYTMYRGHEGGKSPFPGMKSVDTDLIDLLSDLAARFPSETRSLTHLKAFCYI